MRVVGRLLPIVALLCVTAIWGWTFVVVRDAVHSYPVLPFLAIRFTAASLLLLPVLRGHGVGFKAGFLPGLALSAGYLCQTAGLQYTTASKAGLLTGLFVVFTPVLELILYRRRLGVVTGISAVAALTGTWLLTGGWHQSHVGGQQALGDVLEVLTALCFSVHMLLLSKVDARANASRVALAQLAVAAVLFSGGSVMLGGIPSPSGQVLLALVITAALASALAFWIQTFVQQRISPTRTAIVLVAEPAFAVFFGILLAGDRFSTKKALGAILILLALFVNEAGFLVPATRRRPDAI